MNAPKLPKSRSWHRSRRGITLMEMLVASGLLAGAMLTISSFHQRIVSSQRALEQFRLIHTQLNNARSEIRSWSTAEVNSARIEQLPISPAARTQLSQVHWVAQVEDITEPIQGKQIHIALAWQDDDDSRISPGLTFWLKDE